MKVLHSRTQFSHTTYLHQPHLNLVNDEKAPRGKPELAQGNWPQLAQLATYGATDVYSKPDVLSNSTSLQQESLPQLASSCVDQYSAYPKAITTLLQPVLSAFALRHVNAKKWHVLVCHNDFQDTSMVYCCRVVAPGY
jgi:hypothetical protein